MSFSKQLTKWWNLNAGPEVYNNDYSGLYNDGTKNIPVKINITNFYGNLTSSFTFAQTWTAELNAWYNSSASEGLLIARPRGALNLAVSKKILKNQGTIKLGVRDLLRSDNFKGYSRYADVDIVVQNDTRRDNRQLTISFTYKFGKSNIAPERQRSSGASEEQSRVKGGG